MSCVKPSRLIPLFPSKPLRTLPLSTGADIRMGKRFAAADFERWWKTGNLRWTHRHGLDVATTLSGARQRANTRPACTCAADAVVCKHASHIWPLIRVPWALLADGDMLVSSGFRSHQAACACPSSAPNGPSKSCWSGQDYEGQSFEIRMVR
jgi:hypothetical protein